MRSLIVIHIAGALLVTWGHYRLPAFSRAAAVYAAILFAQPLLLAVWLGLGNSPPGQKLVVGTLAVMYLATLWVLVRLHFLGMVLPGVGSALLMFVLRQWKPRLQLSKLKLRAATSEGIRFSMVHLLVLTGLVSLLLAAAKTWRLLRQSTALSGEFIDISDCVLLALCWMGATLAIVWSTLGRGRPHARIVVAFVLAILLNLLFYFTLGLSTWRAVRPIVLQTGTVAAVMIASLLVVRQQGYRLVRQGDRRGSEKARVDGNRGQPQHPD